MIPVPLNPAYLNQKSREQPDQTGLSANQPRTENRTSQSLICIQITEDFFFLMQIFIQEMESRAQDSTCLTGSLPDAMVAAVH